MILQSILSVLVLILSSCIYWTVQPLPPSFHPQLEYPEQGYSVMEIGEDIYSIQTLEWGLRYTCPTTPSGLRPVVVLFDKAREPQSAAKLLKQNYCVVTSSTAPDGSVLESLLQLLYAEKSTSLRVTIKSSGLANFWALSFVSQMQRDRKFSRNIVLGLWMDGGQDEISSSLGLAEVRTSDLWRAYIRRFNKSPLYFQNTSITSILGALLGFRFGGNRAVLSGISEDVWVSTSDLVTFEDLKTNNLNDSNNNLDKHPVTAGSGDNDDDDDDDDDDDIEELFLIMLKRMGKRKKVVGAGNIDFSRVTNLQGSNVGKGAAGSLLGEWLGFS
ncbi:hypothetical protein TrST_g2073 [Triparma strigata]|uniref:Uncharacterized protein n=1 Tax=Triparma strigata TaxID=1606541 RepID=A0A9W7AB66_9STRA|nr:hypothetical protein TrST_g2073 [Triparma strigata]